MKFRIPFTIQDIERLKSKSKGFISLFSHNKRSGLAQNLEKIEAGISREEYLAICSRSFIISFIALVIISMPILYLLKVIYFFLLSPGIALVFAGFIFFSQTVYPSVYLAKKQREIEKNLIPALQNILIQLSSGIPLFSIIANVSSSNYGELSSEFKKIVKRINAGEPEIQVIDDIGRKNPSVFFRRTLWQISNGMRAGSDMEVVIKDSINALNNEQMIQLQNYGNKLNPLVVFYMLISVIIPSLSITFLTILSSMLNIEGKMTMMIFIGLFVFVILAQIMFLGMIRSRRPSLL